MPNLTLQLYSARNIELAKAMDVVAEVGYQSVEAYGGILTDSDALKSGLQSSGLKLVSSHVGLDELRNNLSSTMELLSGMGASHIVCPFLQLDQRPSDVAGWTRLAHSLSGISETLVSNGFTFAWHNHEFEFEMLADGRTPMQILLDETANMHWEIDVGWVVRANHNPNEWLQSYAQQISAVHVKDLAKEGELVEEDGWADVGHGVIDWASMLPSIQNTSAKHFIAEHDKPADFERFAKNSYTSINSWSW